MIVNNTHCAITRLFNVWIVYNRSTVGPLSDRVRQLMQGFARVLKGDLKVPLRHFFALTSGKSGLCSPVQGLTLREKRLQTVRSDRCAAKSTQRGIGVGVVRVSVCLCDSGEGGGGGGLDLRQPMRKSCEVAAVTEDPGGYILHISLRRYI